MYAGQLFWIILCVVMIATGQFLFKVVGLRSTEGLSIQGLLNDHIAQGVLLLALTIYMLATLLWIHVLRVVPLSDAYPFMALAFVIVPLGSWIFFGEQIRWTDGAGTTLIVLGIVLLSRGSV